MGDKTSIEWTDATWNPVVGCSVVSPGCTNCYAMKQAARIEMMFDGLHTKAGSGAPFKPSHYAGTTQDTKAGAVWTGKIVRASDETLTAPLRWKKPRRIFVNSMGDLFHEDTPDEWIDAVFAVMALAPQHTFQVLTKRSKRMRQYFQIDAEHDYQERVDAAMDKIAPAHWHIREVDDFGGWPLKNVWLGVSAEDQTRADERVPDLLATPAAVRFVSAEPLLGPINFARLREYNPKADPWINAMRGIVTKGQLPRSRSECGFNVSTVVSPPELPRLDWIIVGGESGADARPMSIQWAREIRDQCAAAGVPFFFKQWGEWASAGSQPSGTPGRFAFGDYEHDRSTMVRVDSYPRQFTMFGARCVVERVGKHAAGRLLDGREHNDMPVPR